MGTNTNSKKPSLRAQLSIGRGNPGNFNWIASSPFRRLIAMTIIIRVHCEVTTEIC